MTTTSHVRAADVEERWFLFDASEHALGRMAAVIATQLMGKDRPTYTPSETGNTHIVVINGTKPRLSGTKEKTKEYQHYTGYPDGRRVVNIEKVAEKRGKDIVTLAVRRMLPKGRLGHTMLKNLKVYDGVEHPHTAQKPVKVDATL
ncbi:MAG: 50S ribosomal protein L13 [Planctomycetota bacterium]|nr:50S ribosomal protein L13 [Planctomycetota bacterium]